MNTAGASSTERVSEVVRLTTALADQVLMARLEERAVYTEQVGALVKAARFLEQQGEPWPPLLTQALYELSGTTAEGALATGASSAGQERVEGEDSDAKPQDERGLSRFLRLLRKDTSA
ncbi:hypothetical protein [Methylobacterium durans]|uniref:Uncharacterized protein n=1 Tax=Methylobacterium durans TaxID=2202825 RepID=A0A2U8W0F8_9HYPH|nr:hypothetical protein [Methylobacterium durans]AWN39527.1 hypothetical protein DK389_01980 [Methylobacterium durans]